MISPWPALYLDTETSDYHEAHSPSLPVQIAAILATESRTIATVSCILNQRQWQGIRINPIADRVVNIHGITPDIADTYGWPPDLAIGRLRHMLNKAASVVAHNIEFDLSVMDHACGVQKIPRLCWPERFCTMRESAGVLRIPSGGRYSIGGWKAPKLTEAYRWFAKKEMVSNHDALHDVFACRLVHRGILRHRENLLKTDESATIPSGE